MAYARRHRFKRYKFALGISVDFDNINSAGDLFSATTDGSALREYVNSLAGVNVPSKIKATPAKRGGNVFCIVETPFGTSDDNTAGGLQYFISSHAKGTGFGLFGIDETALGIAFDDNAGQTDYQKNPSYVPAKLRATFKDPSATAKQVESGLTGATYSYKEGISCTFPFGATDNYSSYGAQVRGLTKLINAKYPDGGASLSFENEIFYSR